MKHDAVICDLDGTLAIIGDRSPYAAEQCGLDTVNKPVEAVLRWARNDGARVILVSGRGSRAGHREATERWLFWNNIEYDELHMREVGDTSKDHVFKQKVYRSRIKPRFRVLFVLDDRSSVVAMWRSLGLTVFQVDDRV